LIPIPFADTISAAYQPLNRVFLIGNRYTYWIQKFRDITFSFTCSLNLLILVAIFLVIDKNLILVAIFLAIDKSLLYLLNRKFHKKLTTRCGYPQTSLNRITRNQVFWISGRFTKIEVITASTVFARVTHHLGLDRIMMDIANRRQQILIILLFYFLNIIPFLENMSQGTIP
jgi:hypothetical protein